MKKILPRFLLVSCCFEILNALSYPDSVQFLNEKNSVKISCSNASVARTSWQEYLTCKRVSSGLWRPLPKCSGVNTDVISLTAKDDVHDGIIPDFSETFYYISESQCVSRNARFIIHRCDPEAPNCDKCTLPLGIQEGRIPVDRLLASSQSSNSHNADKAAKEHQRPSLGWCAGIQDDKQFLQVDLVHKTVLTGVATRKTDTVEEFMLKYKKKTHEKWHYYEEHGRVKLFRTIRRYRGYTSRHWFANKITARYVRFQVTRWSDFLCVHFELYGCDGKIGLKKPGKMKKIPPFRSSGKIKIPLERHTLKKEEDGKIDPSSRPKKKRKALKAKIKEDKDRKDPSSTNNHRKNALIACYVAAGIIAILGLFIVYKWETNERKIRPDYLK